MNRIKLTALMILLFGLNSNAQDFKKYDSGNFIKGKDSIYYRILFPENFDPTQKYPILFSYMEVEKEEATMRSNLLMVASYF
ncbi:hypothetical protein [Pedobacter steynii]